MLAKRACTADITISRAHLVVANEDDDHQERDNDDARGAPITEESCVKALVIDIVLDPHGREAWGAAILLLDAVAPLHRQRKGGGQALQDAITLAR